VKGTSGIALNVIDVTPAGLMYVVPTKDQQIVERRHRDLKQTLKVRPIFLHNDE